ncbi:MAG TPA: copper chaperone PCu(A)C [Gammaproteobacteria bacterium]|mgnify:CR=1 FL=1|nr:copper chaperone PCu(A)C [Gammaproteobacteria bacterium]
MRLALRRFAFLYVVAAGSAASACDGLAITDAWIREPPPGANAVAAYMTLANHGDETLVLDALTSPGFAHGMLHETVAQDGRVRMRHVPRLSLAPGERVQLAPGALHGMLMQPTAALPRAGEHVELVLGCSGKSTRVMAIVARDAP